MEIAALDDPKLLQFIFYPRQDVRKCPQNASDYFIPVEENIFIGCRFYTCSQSSPSIIYFHGNGEVVGDHNDIAPFYNQRGMNLFVADYRGYGSSGGDPTLANTISDAHQIFNAFLDLLHRSNYSDNILVMGRSLGSLSAIELAFHYQEKLKGLIIESGFASISRLLKHLGLPPEFIHIDDDTFPNAAKIRAITLPALILHGQYDTLVPLLEAKDLFEKSAAEKKYLEIISGADHNTILFVGMERYFDAIENFVSSVVS
jgi:hypothetical protein